MRLCTTLTLAPLPTMVICHLQFWLPLSPMDMAMLLGLTKKIFETKKNVNFVLCSQPIRHNGSFKKAVYLWTLPNFFLPWPISLQNASLSLWGLLGHDNWWQWNDLHGGLVQDTSAAKMRTEQIFAEHQIVSLDSEDTEFQGGCFFC